MKRLKALRTHGLILLVAVIAYLPGFWWGAPHATAEDRRNAWGVDDTPPIGSLAQLHDMLEPGLSPDENFGYPMMHTYIVLASYAPYMAMLAATGKISSPRSDYPYGLSDPVTTLRHLSWIAHLVSVLMGAGIVLAAYVAGAALWGERHGRWAAVFALMSYPMFYYSRTSNVDVPQLFFAAWCLAVFAHALAKGITTRHLAIVGVMAGFAMATKEPIAALFLAMPLALLVPSGTWPGFRSPATVAKAAGVAGFSAFAAYALGSGMVLDFARWKAHIVFGATRTADVAVGAVSFLDPYPNTLAGNWGLLVEIVGRLRDTLTLPGLVLGIIGIALVLVPPRRSVWVLAGALTYLLTLFVAVRTTQLRYVMPAAFVIAIFAGHATAWALESSQRAVRIAGAVAAAAFVAIAGLWAADLTYAMMTDSRYAAGRWIAAVGRPGDRFEYFGAFQKNPPLPDWITSGLAVEYRGGVTEAPRDEATVERIKAGWRERRPRFIVLTPDHTSKPGEPFAHSTPPQIFDALENGSIGYVRAHLFQTPPLIRFLPRPRLDYGAVNPPVRIYVAAGDSAARSGH